MIKISNTDITNAVNQYLEKANEDGGLTLYGLQQLAKTIGVHSPENINSKIMLIHAIQDVSQGHSCFRKNNQFNCMDIDCKWTIECKKLIAVWCKDI